MYLSHIRWPAGRARCLVGGWWCAQLRSSRFSTQLCFDATICSLLFYTLLCSVFFSDVAFPSVPFHVLFLLCSTVLKSAFLLCYVFPYILFSVGLFLYYQFVWLTLLYFIYMWASLPLTDLMPVLCCTLCVIYVQCLILPTTTMQCLFSDTWYKQMPCTIEDVNVYFCKYTSLQLHAVHWSEYNSVLCTLLFEAPLPFLYSPKKECTVHCEVA